MGTLLTIPAQFLVGRAMSANNKVILECEDRSTLVVVTLRMILECPDTAANPLIFKIVIINMKMIVHLGEPNQCHS